MLAILTSSNKVLINVSGMSADWYTAAILNNNKNYFEQSAPMQLFMYM